MYHFILIIRFKASLATNLADIMDKIGLSEIMQPSANYGKISEKPVKVDTMNHKVCFCHIWSKIGRYCQNFKLSYQCSYVKYNKFTLYLGRD